MTDATAFPAADAGADAPSDATLELLAQLVAIDSTSAVSNLPVLEVCEQLLAAAGAWTERVESSDEPGKAGLLARIGPDVDGGVVLSGHTDCVPVTGQPWTTDPFVLTERDGVLVGRGTTDMKGFIAAALTTAVPAAAAAAEAGTLARPLWLLLTWDEEVGTVGAGPMTDALLARTTPTCAIVGEPTSMRPVAAHKGVRSYRVVVRGRDGHSSKPALGTSALLAAARLATHIDEVAAQLRADGGDPLFAPPETTFNVATLHSGQAINIIPRHAELTFEYRPVPADDGWELGERIAAWADQTLLPSMQAIDPECSITFERGNLVHGMSPEQDGAAEALVRALTGFDGEAGTVPFGTDGGWHQEGGISTIVCGPGDIDQAHQPDEWIAPSQLAEAERFLLGLVDSLSEKPGSGSS